MTTDSEHGGRRDDSTAGHPAQRSRHETILQQLSELGQWSKTIESRAQQARGETEAIETGKAPRKPVAASPVLRESALPAPVAADKPVAGDNPVAAAGANWLYGQRDPGEMSPEYSESTVERPSPVSQSAPDVTAVPPETPVSVRGPAVTEPPGAQRLKTIVVAFLFFAAGTAFGWWLPW